MRPLPRKVRDAARKGQALLHLWSGRLTSKQAGVVLVYHRVGGERSGDPKREILPTIAGDVFANQLDHLRRNYAVVPADEIIDAVARRRRWSRFPVAITFDDDLESHVSAAQPALERAGLTATFFLTGASLQEPHSFWWEDLQRAIDARMIKPTDLPHVPESDVRAALDRTPKAIFRVADSIMHLEEHERDAVAAALRITVSGPDDESGLRAHDVEALSAAGFEIGFHTRGHEPLTRLSDDPLARALREGREELAAGAGHELRLIAYPHGLGNDRVAQAARDAGFTLGFVTGRRAVTPDVDPLLVPRMVPALSEPAFALRLARAVAEVSSDDRGG